jgi:hypothetical protein
VTRAPLQRLDAVLHELGAAGPVASPARDLSGYFVVVAAGLWYGAFMGSFSADSLARSLLILFIALKVPLLILATSALCLPGFFVFNSVLGLQEDFAQAMRAIAAAQAALTLALASLAPITALFYLSGISHDRALLLNALLFSISTLAGQVVMRRRYAQLIQHPERGPRHRLMLWLWTLLYAFVGMQMGWMLRPFVGGHDQPVAFFRQEPFSNAYVVLLQLFVRE